MRTKRILQNAVVLAWLAVTASAFLYTMTRITVPVAPRAVFLWSYAMMAPYQSDTDYNTDFVFEGRLPDGTWERIDIAPYMPMGFGERNVRLALRVYKPWGDEARKEKFLQWNLKLLELERAKGKPYTAIREWVEQWPRSNAGYEYLRRDPFFLSRTLLIQAQ